MPRAKPRMPLTEVPASLAALESLDSPQARRQRVSIFSSFAHLGKYVAFQFGYRGQRESLNGSGESRQTTLLD